MRAPSWTAAVALAAAALVPAPIAAQPEAAARASVTIVGLSDYHAHAVPFRSEGRPAQGGIARTVAFLRAARADPATLVLSGGDTLSAGVPAWSDEYRCADWPWLDGLVDAMAVGNHELDYGGAEFDRCRAQARYPILSANLLREDGTPYLLYEGQPWLVRTVAGRKIGIFAVAGPDFTRLVKRENLPAGTHFGDPVESARAAVAALRTREHVDAVILIGHEHRADDGALVRAVPGIDLVLGTHSHLKAPLSRIPGSRAWFVSPYQYLAYVSRVVLRFEGSRLVSVTGGLVRMDDAQPEDPEVAARVEAMQRALIAKHPERFKVIGSTGVELSDARVDRGESLVGNWATDLLRQRTGAHVFLSTASSFRAALPLGDVTEEDFLSAFPYPNRAVVYETTGAQLAQLLAHSVAHRGSNAFSQESGLRYRVIAGRPVAVQVLRDPARPEMGFAPLRPDATYRVGTTDFVARVAEGYKDVFARARPVATDELQVQAVLRAALAQGAVSATLDGRTGAAR